MANRSTICPSRSTTTPAERGPSAGRRRPVSRPKNLLSHLLKSNFPVTRSAGLGRVQIRYAGPLIDRAWLAALSGLVPRSMPASTSNASSASRRPDASLRVRRRLAVYARYTRRGGLDINPVSQHRFWSWCRIRAVPAIGIGGHVTRPALLQHGAPTNRLTTRQTPRGASRFDLVTFARPCAKSRLSAERV